MQKSGFTELTGRNLRKTWANADRASVDRWCPKNSFPPDFNNKTTSAGENKVCPDTNFTIYGRLEGIWTARVALQSIQNSEFKFF
jgi:hypothetical protein